jgi:hypothetical protein
MTPAPHWRALAEQLHPEQRAELERLERRDAGRQDLGKILHLLAVDFVERNLIDASIMADHPHALAISSDERFKCAVCGKVIGKKPTHILTDTDVIACVGCVFDDSRHAHRVCYPDCTVDWHDMYDKPHKHTSCTLAGLRAVIRKGGYHAVHREVS